MRPSTVAGAAVVVALLAPAAPAVAARGSFESQAAVAGTVRAAWAFDEPGSPATAFDSSGLGNHGANQNITGTGTGYQFNGTSSRVVVPDAASLDPGTADFSFGVTLVMTAPPTPANETYDVLRKGLASTSGGEYKLEITNVNGTARARCVVKDSTKVVAAVVAPTSLANGVPHAVTCSKTATGVSVRVDSLAPLSKRVSSLRVVSNASRLGIGAKAEPSARTGFDWFRGRIDDAWIRVG